MPLKDIVSSKWRIQAESIVASDGHEMLGLVTEGALIIRVLFWLSGKLRHPDALEAECSAAMSHAFVATL